MRAINRSFSLIFAAALWSLAGLEYVQAEEAGGEEKGKTSTISGAGRQSAAENLRQRLQQSEAASGFAGGVVIEGGDAGAEGAMQAQPASLADSYWFVRVRNDFVLIPRGSILHWPENLHSVVMDEPRGNRIRWHDFIRSQSSWAIAHPVTREQVRSVESLQAVKESFKHSRQMVIATYNGNPVGILGNKDLAEKEKEEQAP